MLFIKLLRRVTSNMAVESGLDFLGGLCAKPRKFVYIRDQTILQNLIFFYCHEILCMIYHIRAKTYGFFSVGCSQSCIPGPKVG